MAAHRGVAILIQLCRDVRVALAEAARRNANPDADGKAPLAIVTISRGLPGIARVPIVFRREGSHARPVDPIHTRPTAAATSPK